MTQTHTLSLYEFTSRIGDSIHSRPDLRNVWITAELSDVSMRGGHFYTDLIQKNEKGQTIARMRANLWASLYPQLRRKFSMERQDDLRNGIKVRIQGNATHHNLYGLSFNITDIDPSYVDEGDILRRRMEILQQMKNEGIFDEQRGRELPADAHRIAVVSSEGAAGLGDFLNQLEYNPERYRFKVKLFPSPMQGDKAPTGVIGALQSIYTELSNWDCVVLIRGGGATADMNCFDNEQLARNICYFPLPVIVGIGHERDNCVLDYIAHTRCKTPTAVAEFLIAHQRQAWQNVCEKVGEIIRFTTFSLEGEKQRIAQFESAIPVYISQHMEREKLRLNNFLTSIPLAAGSLTSRERTRIESLESQLQPVVQTALARASERLDSMNKLIEVLSPANILRRGYSITRTCGRAVKEVSSLTPGTVIETQLASGSLKSTII